MCTETPLLALEGVAIGYGQRALLAQVNLRLCRGDFWGVVGPNGAGKTTLARTLLGQLRPVAGRVVRAPDLRFGYVPQRHTLDPEIPLRALDIALMGRYDRLGLGRGPSRADREQAMRALERLHIEDAALRPYRTLSGGEKQRVLMARALAAEPDLLVLDEPAEGLDLAGESDLLVFLRELHTSGRLALVMIEHHMASVASVVDHLCLVNRHTGWFEAGPIRELLTEERLSALYGRAVEIDACADRTHVHVRDLRHG